MVERLAILAVAVLVAWVAWRLVQRRLLRRTGSLSRSLDGYFPGRPAIVLFSTPDCAPCETIQRPALAEVRARLDGGLQILEFDALSRPDLADAWGVLGAPTTFLIDARGRARRVNHGPVRAEVLLAQLEEIDAFATDQEPAQQQMAFSDSYPLSLRGSMPASHPISQGERGPLRGARGVPLPPPPEPPSPSAKHPGR